VHRLNYIRAAFVKFPQGVRILGFDIRTGIVPQLGMSTWWKVARSAGVSIREGRQEGIKIDPLNLFMNTGGQTF